MTDREIIDALRDALSPFAGVASWEERCAETDRDAKLYNTTLHISTGAMSSGYELTPAMFEKARRAFNLR